MTYLDTHVVVWLYAFGGGALSAGAALAIESDTDIRISPMVRLELQYLREIDRISRGPRPVLAHLHNALGLTTCPLSFSSVVENAEEQRWTRDPFDRVIVAQAALPNAALVTKDQFIHANYARAVWS